MFSDILLTVDYDRTLTGPDSSVPARNIEAIEYFIAQGGAFTVNTGRSLPMSKPFLDHIPLSAPLLLYNGSGAYDVKTGSITQAYPIDLDPKEFIGHLMELFPNLTVEVQGIAAHYAFRKNEDWEKFSQNGGCAWAYAVPGGIDEPFLKCAINGDCSGHTSASMYDATETEINEMRAAIDTLRQLYGDKVEVFHSVPKIVDIHAKGVSKLRSARDLQKAMGRKILICVGDSGNDLSMLEGADFAFCPSDGALANRFPTVCKCADGAVAEVIYKKIPEILQNNS